MAKDVYRVLKRPKRDGAGTVIFSIVGNEMYFLPHFLEHYRNLGIQEFCFLVDTSDDGTLEYLMEQEDCWVLESDIQFGDRVRIVHGDRKHEKRFGTAAKFLIPKALFQGRWVLTVDADEFLVLPQPSTTILELIERLEGNGLNCCRALMVDFLPTTLTALDKNDSSASPFSLNPFYDVVFIEWQNKSPEPERVIFEMEVRTRLYIKMMADLPEQAQELGQIGGVRINKVPLLKWSHRTVVTGAHTSNHLPDNRVQVAFAHFKFFPGWKQKVDDAIKREQYYNASSKYKALKLAYEQLGDWPLEGPWSRKFVAPESLERSGLVFDRL